ncbi:MAG: YwaF family protein [Bacilli bacterium]|nr:YwaF family protein [Bacilli bacterium]
MNFIEKLLDILSMDVAECPTSYGRLHLLFCAIVIGVTLFLSIRHKNCSDKKYRTIIGICWGIMFLFEVYKQIQYSCHTNGSTAYWEYKWYIFPFQFCSTPLYILPLVFLLPDGKVRDAAMSFTSLFALFAGLAVFVYPEGIFVKEILISIQSLTHHGMQIVTGIFTAVWARKRFNLKFYLKGLIVFAIMSAIAMTLNLTVQPAVEPNSFNMFYISPYRNSSLPVLSMIQPKVPYPVFLILYLVGFGLAGLIVYYAEFGSMVLANKLGKNKQNKEAI